MSMPPFALILTAAGSSLRFSSSFEMGQSVKKEFLRIDGHTVLFRACEPFFELPSLTAVVVTCKEGSEDETIVAMEDLADISTIPILFIKGGQTRQESVHLALERLSQLDIPFELVAVHDGARPFVTPELIINTMAMAFTHGAAIPALTVTDSIRKINREGKIVDLTDRRGLVRVQTPQIFSFQNLLDAHRLWSSDPTATDDAEVYIKAGYSCYVVEGSEQNRKITYEEDIPDARAQIAEYIEQREKGREDRQHSELFRRLLHQGENK